MSAKDQYPPYLRFEGLLGTGKYLAVVLKMLRNSNDLAMCQAYFGSHQVAELTQIVKTLTF